MPKPLLGKQPHPLYWSGAALVFVGLLSLCLGAESLTLAQLFDALTHQSDPHAQFIVTELRLPRTLIAMATGAALACAGALMQTLSRNPLAEPGLMGISAGSSFAVTCAILFGSAAANMSLYVAQAGALAGCFIALSAARIQGVGNDPVRLILAGTTLNGLLLSLVSIILLFDERTADEVRFWIIGSVAGRDITSLYQAMPSFLLAAVLVVLIARPLAALALGERTAQSLGFKPQQTRILAVIAVALLTGSATAIAGPLIFVGLVVPYFTRRLAGPDIRKNLWLCLLLGPVVVVCADIVSRLAVAPTELPLGVMTALIGAPVLMLLVRGRRLPTL